MRNVGYGLQCGESDTGTEMNDMKRMATVVVAALMAAGIGAEAQTKAEATVASVMESHLKLVEQQFVAVAEAMPADNYDFAPPGPNFDGVRTFALEVRHVAAANMGFYSVMLGQPLPAGVSFNGATNGPEELKTKAQIVAYLKESFALGHKAIAAMTPENQLGLVPNAPGPFMNTRLGLASFSIEHANDHYGQMVVYLRMNGVVPPPSAGSPPANPGKK
jgi:uncharacterized damage-inducible protein DinB